LVSSTPLYLSSPSQGSQWDLSWTIHWLTVETPQTGEHPVVWFSLFFCNILSAHSLFTLASSCTELPSVFLFHFNIFFPGYKNGRLVWNVWFQSVNDVL
jgi:hypothetical protein